MAKRYSTFGEDTNTTNTTILTVTGGTTVRPALYDLVLGSDATPADNAAEYLLQRITTAGSGGTAVTPVALDPNDPAAASASIAGPSSEPTYTSNAILLRFYCNQRATFRWVAAPGSELKIPATSANGIGLLVGTVAGSSVNVGATILFEE